MPIWILLVALFLTTVIPAPIKAKMPARRVLPAPAMCRAIRTTSGLTQADIAEILDVSRETVARWELGKRIPRLDIATMRSRLVHAK